MDEARKDSLRAKFNRKLKPEFHAVIATIDTGLSAYRESDEVLGLTVVIEPDLTDNRTGKNVQHGLIALPRQLINSRSAGYDCTNDAERQCVALAMRNVVGGRAKDGEVWTM